MTHQAQLIFVLLLLFVIGFGTLAQRLRVPYPILLVVAGLLLSPFPRLFPRLPRIALDPDFVFLAVLPPLLFAAACQTSWREFRFNLVSILGLAFGLVIFTVLGISLAAHFLLPGFDWRLGLVLGAVVAPTDAIAATAIGQRLGLPSRITDLLEGESLVNDATGLLALELASALIITGHFPPFGEGALRFVLLVAGGIGMGLIVAKLVYLVHRRIDNTPIEITLTLVTPYVAYMAAEEVKASGVLAAVAAGLYIGRKASYIYSSRLRLDAVSVWSTLTFVLNGVVFVLIGLQLPYILVGIRHITIRELFVDALEFSIAVILLRLIWVYPGAYLSYYIRRRFFHEEVQTPSARAIFVVGWTGMRGVVSLAAAISLPASIANGQPFPNRSYIIFLTFCAIVVTLVLQGLTLPPLIRALGLSGSEAGNEEHTQARTAMLKAALARLEELRGGRDPRFEAIYDEFSRMYRRQLGALTASHEESGGKASEISDFQEHYRTVVREICAAERSAMLALRNQNVIGDAVLRGLERELDLIEVRYGS